MISQIREGDAPIPYGAHGRGGGGDSSLTFEQLVACISISHADETTLPVARHLFECADAC